MIAAHELRLTAKNWIWAGLLVAAAAASFAYGLATEPVRAWSSFLSSAFYFYTLALGAAVFLAMNYVSNAGWYVILKRVPEALTTYIPVGGLTLLVVLAGAHTLYHWTHTEAVAKDALLQWKAPYLNLPGFVGRMVFFVVLWSVFGYLLRRYSRRQDKDGDVRHTGRSKVVSAIFLVVFAYSFSVACFDWLMSIEPHWYSTIYGLYNLGGLLTSGVAVIIVACIMLRRRGMLPGFNENHLHDLSKLLFAFATLWAYLWLSQYLLIWYANIPEEISYVVLRTQGGWTFLFWLNVVLNFAIPFFALLPRGWKRLEPHVLWVAGVVLMGRWLDIYLEVAPGNQPSHQGLSWQEPVLFLGFATLFGGVVLRGLRAAPLTPKNDPYLIEAVHLHQ